MKYFFLFICFPLTFILQAQSTKDTIQARTLYKDGLMLLEKADYEASLEKLSKSREIYNTYSNWLMAVSCNHKITQNLIREGKFDQALQTAQEVEQYGFAKLNPKSTQEAEWYNLLGEIYLNKGRNDLALQNFQEALQTYQKFHPQKKAEIAQSYSNIGLVYWNTGKRELALEHQQQALSIRQSIHGESHPDIGASYNDIGLIHSSLDLEKALEFYQKALTIYQKIYGENHPKTANAYNNLAIVNRQEKKYKEALENLDKVLEIREKVYGAEHPNIAFVYATMGQVYLDQESFLPAMEYQKKALAIYQKNYGEKHPEIANILNLMGTTYVHQNKYDLALESYQKALIANIPKYQETDIYQNPDAKEYYNPNFLLNSLLLKAQAFEARHFGKSLKMKDLLISSQTLELCDQLVENMRQLTSNKSDKIALGVIASEVYEDGIRINVALSEVVLNKKEYWKKAFYFAEKSKSAVLLEAISDTDAKEFANIPQNLLEQERQLKSDIAFCELKLAERPDAKVEKTFRDRLFDLNRQYETFIKNLEEKYAEYYALKYNVKTAGIDEVQAILDDETELYSYFIAEKDKRLFIFRISQNNFKVYNLPQIENFTKHFISLRNGIQFDAHKPYVESAYQLYKQLFPQKINKNITKLIIIPDGGLGTIPFEALLTQKPITHGSLAYKNLPYLIHNQAISYSYSTTLLVQNLQKAAKSSNTATGIFLCAPVVFAQKGLNNLDATETEVKEISKLFAAQTQVAQCYLRKDANEKIVKSNELKKYRYLHFATHGTVNEEYPELSQIFLSPETKAKEDGNLFSGEIYNLEIDADLVTLSACETGLGKLSKGEGIIGLSRALLYAGAKNLIVSYWTVADESTAKLLISFYQSALKKSDNSKILSFSQALQQAKLKMLENEDFARPYFWAAFILIGK